MHEKGTETAVAIESSGWFTNVKERAVMIVQKIGEQKQSS